MPLPSLLATSWSASTVLVVLADVALILVLAALAGRLARRLGQPAVVGEILAGIALGPTLLGLLSADLPGTLFPDDARSALGAIADVGLVLFMFGVGREADPGLLRRAGGRIGALATGSIAVPALVGALVALPLWADHATVDGQAVPRAVFVAFLAIALSVTAFPVLARILDEVGMLRGRIGTTAMAVAAVTDLAAWSALAVVVGLHGAGDRSIAVLLVGVPGCIAVFLLVVRPAVVAALGRIGRGGAPGATGVVAADAADVDATADAGSADADAERPAGDGPVGAAATPTATTGDGGHGSSAARRATGPGPSRAAAALVLLVGLGLAATATDLLGLHAAIGAFTFGLLAPRRGAAGAAADVGSAVLGRAGLLLVPVFFLTTGLGVDLARIGAAGLTELAVLLVAATGAKFVGVAGAARLTGMGRRDAVVLGTLLNARGLTELVVLEVGRSAGIIDERTFAALVAVALLTTVATGAAFRRLRPEDDAAVGAPADGGGPPAAEADEPPPSPARPPAPGGGRPASRGA